MLHLPLALSMALLSGPADAREVENGIRAAVFTEGLNFAEELVSGLDFDLEYEELAGEYSCYDLIGVRDFNLSVPLDELDIWAEDGVLNVIVDFGTIRGEEMEIFGEDEDWLDACVSFSSTIYYFNFENARLSLNLVPRIEDGQLVLDVLDDPQLTGDLDTDIAWFPDDLVLGWFEETIIETVATTLGEALPEQITPLLSDVLLGLEYENFSVDVGLEDIELSRDGFALTASPDILWSGNNGCPSDGRERGGEGRVPFMDFGDGGGADFAVAVTEGMVNELFQSAWQDGFFCFDEVSIASLLTLVEDYFDPDIVDLAGTASLGAPPRLVIEPDGISVTLENIQLDVTGVLDGQGVTLLSLAGDVDGEGALGLDQGISAFTLGLRDLRLDITRLYAEHFVSDVDTAEANISHFAENWVGAWAAEQTEDFVLFDTLYSLWEVILRVDRVEYETGGVAVYVDLYASDDPAVDGEPPNTVAQVVTVTDDGGVLVLSGTDNREGALAYSYKVDDGAWSSWAAETQVELTEIPPGDHEIQAIARDAWLNVDVTPAVAELVVPGDDGKSATDGEKKGCGCASRPGDGSAAWLLGLLGLLGLRRRS